MSSIQKRGDKWRAFVHVDNKRSSKTFATKKEAVEWSQSQEINGVNDRYTLRDAIKKYKKIAETHKGYQSELSRLSHLEGTELARSRLEDLTPSKIAKYRDKRLESVAATSVRREMIILASMLRVARDEWGWIASIPTESVKKPSAPPARRRGVAQEEIDRVCSELETMRVGKQVADMFRLSIESGMRLGEMVSLRWDNVSDKSVTLPATKNGDIRHVPLSLKAREIIAGRVGIDKVSVFTLSAQVASKTFQRARTSAGIPDLHFHDARSEAITRLSKKLDVMQLAKMIGHRDLKSLMFYYAETPESIADRL